MRLVSLDHVGGFIRLVGRRSPFAVFQLFVFGFCVRCAFLFFVVSMFYLTFQITDRTSRCTVNCVADGCEILRQRLQSNVLTVP